MWGEVTASLTPQRKTHENQERVGIIGINIRPATTTVALADLDAHFVAQESLPTAGTPQQFIAELVPRIRKLIKTVAKVSVVD